VFPPFTSSGYATANHSDNIYKTYDGNPRLETLRNQSITFILATQRVVFGLQISLRSINISIFPAVAIDFLHVASSECLKIALTTRWLLSDPITR